MPYFVTGATGFIGRHLVECLLQRDGDIYVLVREGSLEKLNDRWGDEPRIKPVIGDLAKPRLGVSDEDVEKLKGDVEHYFHLAAVYDMAAPEEANRVANVEGTRHAVELANAITAGTFHHTSSIAAAGLYKGLFREDMFDEGQKLDHPVPPHEVRGREDRADADADALAGVPARDRRRQLRDRRDGQDRRALLLLHRDQAAAPLPARLVSAGRSRARLHEHRPGRLRRGRDGPHRASAWARWAGLPPDRAQVGALGRGDEHDRAGSPCAADVDADRHAHPAGPAEGHVLDADAAARRRRESARRSSPTSGSPRRCSATSA